MHLRPRPPLLPPKANAPSCGRVLRALRTINARHRPRLLPAIGQSIHAPLDAAKARQTRTHLRAARTSSQPARCSQSS
eukprot:2865325-Pleurochrysis_carterae.AAC.1